MKKKRGYENMKAPKSMHYRMFVYGAAVGAFSHGSDLRKCLLPASLALLARLMSLEGDTLRTLLQSPDLCEADVNAVEPSNWKKSIYGLAHLIESRRVTLKIEKGVVLLFHSSEDYMNCPMISEIQAQTVAWWVEKTAGTKRISKMDQREQRLFAVAVRGVNIAQQYKSSGVFAQMWRLKVCDRNLPFEVLRDFEKRSKTAISSACSVFGVRTVPIILLFLDEGSKLVCWEEALEVLTENFGGVFSKNGTVNQPSGALCLEASTGCMSSAARSFKMGCNLHFRGGLGLPHTPFSRR